MPSLVELHSVSKSYGAVQALKNVSLDIARGEIHSLLGENGAGKSTTMRIIKGETVPSSGTVSIDGKVISRYHHSQSKHYDIAMVHQELAVFRGLSVAENILPSLPNRTKFGFIKRKELYQRATEMLSVFSLDIDPSTPMSSLTTGQMQIIEILRSVSAGRQLLILDEPTSSLNVEETKILLNLIHSLRAEGTSILFVSHRIPEVLNISDRISILRDGVLVNTYKNSPAIDEKTLVSSMIGRDVINYCAERINDSPAKSPIVLEVNNLSGYYGCKHINFVLHQGEILGFFGLEGSGVAQLSNLLFGIEALCVGRVSVKGQQIRKPSPIEMIRNKITYLPSDRSESGLYLNRALVDSVTATVLDGCSKLGFLRTNFISRLVEGFIKRFAIKTPSVSCTPVSLSGGNQQKIMMAACLAANPEIMIVNEPTRGVDIGAKSQMHKTLVDMRNDGMSMLVFSSELPELIGICDRLIILRANTIVGELQGESLIEKEAIKLAASSVGSREELQGVADSA